MKTAEQIAEELWEKYSYELPGEAMNRMSKDRFTSALHEYGAAVRQRAAGVCRERGQSGADKWADSEMETAKKADAWECLQCAAAIERMELP